MRGPPPKKRPQKHVEKACVQHQTRGYGTQAGQQTLSPKDGNWKGDQRKPINQTMDMEAVLRLFFRSDVLVFVLFCMTCVAFLLFKRGCVFVCFPVFLLLLEIRRKPKRARTPNRRPEDPRRTTRSQTTKNQIQEKPNNTWTQNLMSTLINTPPSD